MLEVAGVGAMWCPGEAVIASWENDYATFVHLAEATNRCVEFVFVADLLCFFVGVAKCFGIIHYAIDYEMLKLVVGGAYMWQSTS